MWAIRYVAKGFVAVTVSTVAIGVASGREAASEAADSTASPQNEPADSSEIVRLGRRLFFDRELSADRTVSCASCHQPEHGWSGPDKLARGVGGCVGKRHVPNLYNVRLRKELFWDGRETSLETMVLKPVQDSCEMNQPVGVLIDRLQQLPRYRTMFSSAKVGLDEAGVAQALAAFCRTIVAADAPIDRYRAGDSSALSPAAKRGHDLFYFRLNCSTCHTGPHLTDGKFHNLGVGMDQGDPDLGRFLVTGNEHDRGAFRTPSLRNLAKTAPYMHDGRFDTLSEVLEFYKQGGHYNPNLDPMINLLPLDDAQSADLIVFLTEGLTSESDPAAAAAVADDLEK